MALLYTEEQKELIKAVHDVAESEIKPHVAAADEAGKTPDELWKWGFDLGLHLVEIPEEFGGMGLDYETCAMMFEELAKVDAAYADTFVTNFVAFRNIHLKGTPEQAQHFVDKTIDNGFAAFCLTEANAGSDVAGMKSTAVLDGDEYVLNGTKSFITNGSIASIYVIFAKTDPEARGHGITAFLVDGDTPGLSAGAHENKMGFRLSDTTEVIMDNVRVPKSAVIGKPGEGMSIALNALNLSRAFISTLGVGIMQRAVDEAVTYAQQRKQFGKRLPDGAGSAGRHGHQDRGFSRHGEQLHAPDGQGRLGARRRRHGQDVRHRLHAGSYFQCGSGVRRLWLQQGLPC